eukprot:CAMPEP_0201933600 /NCGR_PEP_ID=MMETSP0903-20130614/31912_1 /ASSEMBLY_ACC=CAM_ASM_000552 /TAXON_ID=420261 /ORGANISM="Thalassiosira antarctica, Strain CCMP982" /LENGTH=34 /DNA_ID= /DNA_START= /DNA_END= /DNA_ORIENTATION=
MSASLKGIIIAARSAGEESLYIWRTASTQATDPA